MRLLALGMLAACYGPHVSPGAQCGPGGACPEELTCSPATNTCEVKAVDAAVDSAGDGTTVTNDGPADGMIDSPPGQFCYGTGIVHVCFPQQPTGGYAATLPTTFDTTNDAACTSIDGMCVIAADTITIGPSALFAARGSRPLVFVGVSSVTIAGILDVSSKRSNNTVGPAANSALCNAPTAPTGEGGGAGGSFGGTGGAGGPDEMAADGGTAGAAATAVTSLRGGCAGGNGSGTGFGAGGAGGGAVYLISPGSIDIMGAIDASGAGGFGATMVTGTATGAGAGGGGSGGMIGLDAPTITLATSGGIFANGGGGGEGSTPIANGNPGNDSMGPGLAATGGTGGTASAGDGGRGSSFGVAGHMAGGGSPGGGGGGGGAAGVIKVYSSVGLSGPITPPPS